MKRSYFGIVGFISSKEVKKFDEKINYVKNGKSVRDLLLSAGKKIMIGVHVNLQSLNGYVSTNPNRYPLFDDVSKLFLSDELYLNTIYYNSDDLKNLSRQLHQLAQIPNLSTIQLEMAWPDIDVVRDIKRSFPNLEIILQIGSAAYYEVGNSPSSLYSRIELYKNFIDGVLIDIRRGPGMLEDVNNELIKVVVDIHSRFSGKIGVAISGGLCADSVMNLIKVVEFIKSTEFGTKNLSVIAESLIKDEKDQLSINEALKFIFASYALFL